MVAIRHMPKIMKLENSIALDNATNAQFMSATNAVRSASQTTFRVVNTATVLEGLKLAETIVNKSLSQRERYNTPGG